MSVCNIFKPLSNPTGNFLLFSQYANDLTKSATHTDPYRVIPSKFMVMNLNYNNFDNETIVKHFIDYYENACAVFKSIKFQYLTRDTEQILEWSPDVSKSLFWNCLVQANLLKNPNTNKLPTDPAGNQYYEEILYMGDINIQSNNIYNNDGYNEIYCYIPSYENCKYVNVIGIDTTGLSSYTYNEEYIYGYNADSVISSDIEKLIKVSGELEYKPYNILSLSEGDVRKDITKYSFNTIVVLYDIYIIDDEGNWVVEYENIPMGIHFCGNIENGNTTNYGTVYVSNEDIYGGGSSYGLKICNRYTATTDRNIININNLDSETDDNNIATLNILMSEMCKVLDKMNDIITDVYNKSQTDKELLSLFKNNRTNVPYIKWVGVEPNKEPYWFVNGRNTGVSATKVADHEAYEGSEVLQEVNAWRQDLGMNEFDGDDLIVDIPSLETPDLSEDATASTT